MADEIDFARLAAFIDGEGCILIHRQKQYSRKSKPHWRPHYIVQVVVTNISVKLVRWCKDNFGGFITPYVGGLNRKRQCFKWTAHSGECCEILMRCLPYFVIKRDQAEIAIEFRSTYSKEYVGRGRFVPDEVIAKRDLLVERLHNARASVGTMLQ
jgi:hypothetical protein